MAAPEWVHELRFIYTSSQNQSDASKNFNVVQLRFADVFIEQCEARKA